MVDDGVYSADRLVVSESKKCLALIAFIERMLRKSDHFLLVHAKRRNPRVVVFIDLPRQLQELLPLVFVGDGDDRDGRHTYDLTTK